MNKLKSSDSADYSVNLNKLWINGIKSILISIALASCGAFFIMWNSFPDSIAVYNPFEKKIHIRNLNNIDSFVMFITAAIVVLSLVLNSLYYTRSDSGSMKSIYENSKICFSLTLLDSDYWSCFSFLTPVIIFFTILYINYWKGNIYGITMEYLGILTYF